MGDIKSIKWVRRSNLSSKEKTRVRTLANAHNSHEAQIRMNNHNLKYMRKEKIRENGYMYTIIVKLF